MRYQSRENQYLARHEAWLKREAKRLAEAELAKLIRNIIYPVTAVSEPVTVMTGKEGNLKLKTSHYRGHQYPNEPNGGTS